MSPPTPTAWASADKYLALPKYKDNPANWVYPQKMVKYKYKH